MKRVSLVSTALTSALVLAACGGGGSSSGSENPQDEPPVPTYATGQWEGTSSTGRKLEGFVLQDGSYYVFYSRADRNSVLGGFIQGSGVSNLGNFTSAQAWDFNVEMGSVLPGSATGTYVAGQTLNGSFAYEGGESFTFTTTYDTTFSKVPTLTAFAGEYPGSLVSTLGVEDVTIKALATGEISATTTSGCTVTGMGTARTEGNVFDISLTFGGAPCLFADKTLQGMAYLHPTKRLYLAVTDSEKTGGLLFATKKGQSD